ncbi:hypothetical protein ACJIZ3_005490 [Penstemon smallii]|uniref:Cation efflux protein transmembrane domain-containing protein n=1 Tax=Penstemon smallii TaxID=265156 RepID=A0ABD3S510_9LAMI
MDTMPLLSQQSLYSNNSTQNLREDFATRLPTKVKTGLDPEDLSKFDIAKINGLAEGEKEYYERQFEVLRSFEEVDAPIVSNTDEVSADDVEHEKQELAMAISNWANIFLLLFKIYATVQSGSLAIGASTLDSVLDLLAGAILWMTNHSMKNINIYRYPIGKLRVQPAGIIVFAAIMATLDSEKMSTDQTFWMCIIMVTATGVKLVLWIYCRSSRNQIVRAYAKDHYFDVVTNMVGLVAALLGNQFFRWMDPLGATGLAIYTIKNWSGTVLENAASLVGLTAPPEMLQKLTYLALRHSPLTKHIDTVRAYTFELPEDMPLKEAHDIGESLQNKIENLDEVERAFVHLDHECDHKPEHTILSRLPDI